MTLQDEVIKILASAMGPAAGPFLARQCKQRLNKTPDALVKTDLATLGKWIEIGAGLILGNDVGARLAGRVLLLSTPPKQPIPILAPQRH